MKKAFTSTSIRTTLLRQRGNLSAIQCKRKENSHAVRYSRGALIRGSHNFGDQNLFIQGDRHVFNAARQSEERLHFRREQFLWSF
jgi:hypothetical protein